MPALARKYRDLNLDFSPNPVTGDVGVLEDSDAVRRAVRNLILTNFYERQFQPGMGSGVAQLLFDPITPATSQHIKSAITETISRWEPRAKSLKVDVTVSEDDNGYSADIFFYIVNLRDPIKISVFLQRSR